MKRGSRLRRRIPARLGAVDSFCRELRESLLCQVPQEERFGVELLVREALTNAVVHGAKQKLESHVLCEIRMVAGGIQVRVADSGDGFDWRARLEATPHPLAECGRGLHILNHYASEFRFNEKGNCLQVTRLFRQGEGHAGI